MCTICCARALQTAELAGAARRKYDPGLLHCDSVEMAWQLTLRGAREVEFRAWHVDCCRDRRDPTPRVTAGRTRVPPKKETAYCIRKATKEGHTRRERTATDPAGVGTPSSPTPNERAGPKRTGPFFVATLPDGRSAARRAPAQKAFAPRSLFVQRLRRFEPASSGVYWKNLGDVRRAGSLRLAKGMCERAAIVDSRTHVGSFRDAAPAQPQNRIGVHCQHDQLPGAVRAPSVGDSRGLRELPLCRGRAAWRPPSPRPSPGSGRGGVIVAARPRY